VVSCPGIYNRVIIGFLTSNQSTRLTPMSSPAPSSSSAASSSSSESSDSRYVVVPQEPSEGTVPLDTTLSLEHHNVSERRFARGSCFRPYPSAEAIRRRSSCSRPIDSFSDLGQLVAVIPDLLELTQLTFRTS
jgi:hypothetical protein